MISVKDGHVSILGDDAEIAAELTILMNILIREHSAAFAVAMAMTTEPIDVNYHKIQRSCDNCRFGSSMATCSYWSSTKVVCEFWECK